MASMQSVTLSKFDEKCRQAAASMNFRPVLEGVRQDVIYHTRSNFFELHDPDGETWAPLKHPRPNSRGADRPLNDIGYLYASVTSPGAEGNIDEKSERKIEWGTNLDYSAVHQYGAVITPKIAKLLAIPATVDAQNIGSPRKWPDGALTFQFGKGGRYGGGVAKDLKGEIQYYFARKVTIPARKYLGITENQADEYADWAGDFAAEQVAKAFEG